MPLLQAACIAVVCSCALVYVMRGCVEDGLQAHIATLQRMQQPVNNLNVSSKPFVCSQLSVNSCSSQPSSTPLGFKVNQHPLPAPLE